jgi:hypothetical protein
MMMMRRRSNRDMPLIGRRLLRSTRRDRDRDIPPASPPPLTDRVVIVLTDDDDDGGAGTAAGGSKAAGGDDIDWENQQGDDE